MTNDEWRMTKECLMTNANHHLAYALLRQLRQRPVATSSALMGTVSPIRTSLVISHSFVIRHSSFVSPPS
jgi:hypothetical protein